MIERSTATTDNYRGDVPLALRRFKRCRIDAIGPYVSFAEIHFAPPADTSPTTDP